MPEKKPIVQSETIDDLKGGEVVRVRFHYSDKEPVDDLITRFIGFVQEGDYLRARFQEEKEPFVWNARKVGSRWLYGVNENEYLTVAEVIKAGSAAFVYDPHITRISGRVQQLKDEPDFLSSEQREKKKPTQRSRKNADGMPRRKR